MARPQYLDILWGRPSTNEPEIPFHYPILVVLAIAASIAPTTWILSRIQGYLIVGLALGLLVIYALVFTNIRLTTEPVFAVLFGGYWLGLVAHYYYFAHSELLQYILVTPLAVFATVIVLPQFIEDRSQTFTMGLTGVSVLVSLIGVWILLYAGSFDTPRWVGEEVMGLYAIRSTSVFHNPNTYGFFMMLGSLAAFYTLLVRGGIVWLGALAICVLGLFMSEGDAALIGFGIGFVIVLAGRSTLLSLLGIGVAVGGMYGLIQVGHIPEVMESTLMSRVELWVLSLERLALDPLWGIGFRDAATEIGGAHGPHNSYIHVLLASGLIAGSLYLGAIAYAAAMGIRRSWTPWTGFVLGTGAGVGVYMSFESLFLGGLSTSSVVLGLVLGLMLLPSQASDEHEEPQSATAPEDGTID